MNAVFKWDQQHWKHFEFLLQHKEKLFRKIKNLYFKINLQLARFISDHHKWFKEENKTTRQEIVSAMSLKRTTTKKQIIFIK